ncbi:PilZ domain-containing protein [Kiloniella sp. b19]|uniref:PilZ domain-containing protein n=1 Tax=Kiloniella sp. GXU_MW_B19 TaxID=3141326 RepID=UPI0031D54F7B
MTDNNSQDNNRRIHERLASTDETTFVLSIGEREIGKGVILDMSLGGFRIASKAQPELGSGISLTHPVAGTFEGVVVWTRPDVFGVRVEMTAPERERVLRFTCLAVFPDHDVPQPQNIEVSDQD